MASKKKNLREWRRWEHSLFMWLSSKTITINTETLLPRKWMSISCWWEVENKTFSFVLLLCTAFAFISQTAVISIHEFLILFYSPALLRRRSENGLVGPGIQPRSTHHCVIWWTKILQWILGFICSFQATLDKSPISYASVSSLPFICLCTFKKLSSPIWAKDYDRVSVKHLSPLSGEHKAQELIITKWTCGSIVVAVLQEPPWHIERLSCKTENLC